MWENSNICKKKVEMFKYKKISKQQVILLQKMHNLKKTKKNYSKTMQLKKMLQSYAKICRIICGGYAQQLITCKTKPLQKNMQKN